MLLFQKAQRQKCLDIKLSVSGVGLFFPYMFVVPSVINTFAS